jgi:hypothetical protein
MIYAELVGHLNKDADYGFDSELKKCVHLAQPGRQPRQSGPAFNGRSLGSLAHLSIVRLHFHPVLRHYSSGRVHSYPRKSF